MNHPLEEEIEVDGRRVRVTGLMAVKWREVRDDPELREHYLNLVREDLRIGVDARSAAGRREAMRAVAAALNAKIEACHEEVACPKCGEPVGERCRRAGRGGSEPPLKHPHKERWTQVVPLR